MTNDNESTDNAEAARAQAEARRQRILEKANQRMEIVSGEQGQNGEENVQSASSAARIRAARHRRYRQKTVAASDTPTSARGEATTEEKTTEKKEPKEVESTPSSFAHTQSEDNEVKESPNADVKDKTTVENSPTDESQINSSSNPSTGSSETRKKKYLGIAKMRRQKIAQKKLSEAEAEKESLETSTSVPVIAPKGSFPVLPLYMHVLTVLLLFLAGVDVGLQMHHEEVQVHTTLAFYEHGIPLINQPLNSKVTAEADIQHLADSDTPAVENTPEDEFQAAEDDVYEPNIDPLFGVDLDALTKGPGILYIMARHAVSIHRFFFNLLYYAPLNAFTAIMQTPPALCVVAIILRQIVGKVLLNAGIPDFEGQGKKDGGIEILAMVKNAVSNTLCNTFPKAVAAYDVFVHLRSDMYVVMCGVFVGMTWMHTSTIFKEPTAMPDMDEL